jgi:hypothetical protein
MPTYIVRAPANRLSAEQKARLARMITKTHSETVGRPTISLKSFSAKSILAMFFSAASRSMASYCSSKVISGPAAAPSNARP